MWYKESILNNKVVKVVKKEVNINSNKIFKTKIGVLRFLFNNFFFFAWLHINLVAFFGLYY